MLNHFKQLDRLLRGDATSSAALRFGTILIPIDKIGVAILLLASLYGFCMGIFSLVNGNDALLQRMLATIVKVPSLLFLTLVVTLPSLYTFNALVGSRLSAGDVLRLLLGSLGVMVAVLASFGPIVAFFSISTTSYAFMLLLNVALFAVAGGLGLRFMMRTLERLTRAQEKKQDGGGAIGIDGEFIGDVEHSIEDSVGEGDGAGDRFADFESALASGSSKQGALERELEIPTDPKVRTVFRIWIVVFGLVGAQMGWVLRPFVGDPNLPFSWLRPRESGFFEAVGRALLELIAG